MLMAIRLDVGIFPLIKLMSSQWHIVRQQKNKSTIYIILFASQSKGKSQGRQLISEKCFIRVAGRDVV